MLNEKIQETKIALSTALEGDDLRDLSVQPRMSSAELFAGSLEFWAKRSFPVALSSWLANADEKSGGRFLAYRSLLLQNSLESLSRLPTLPVDDAVKLLMCDEYASFTNMDPDWNHFFNPQEYSFRALLGISICKRFRTGLLDWEEAGFPRSWLAKVPRLHLFPTLNHLLFRMHGFKPFWFPHNAFLRGRVQFMREREWEHSLVLMARSMQMQPEVKGILTGSWFYAPETHRVTPHLKWTTRIFLENGAFMTNTGLADPGAGFLQGAKERQELYERGDYRPTETILLWPRKDILNWLANRPVKVRKTS